MKKPKNNIYTITNLPKDIYINNYKSYSTQTPKIVGKTKHFPAASKEWRDSAYTYNKNYLKSLPFKNNMTDGLIKSHFYVSNQKNLARSHRMRNLIRKSTTKNLFVSKPEIKHNNDKNIITIYTYDREKQSFVKKLLFYNRKFSLYFLWLINNYQKKINYSNFWSIKKDVFSKEHKQVSRKNFIVKKNHTKRSLPYFGKKLKNISPKFANRSSPYLGNVLKNLPFVGNKFKNEVDFFRFREFKYSNKKLQILDNSLKFLFISNLLSIFNIKIFPFFNYINLHKKKENLNILKYNINRQINLLKENHTINNDLKVKRNLILKKWNDLKKRQQDLIIKEEKLITNKKNALLEKKPKLLFWISTKSNTLQIVKNYNINTQLLNDISDEYINNFDVLENKTNLIYSQQLFNNYLWKFIENNLIKTDIITIEEIDYLYKNFKSEHSKLILSKMLKKRSNILYEYAKLELNKLKFTNLLLNLKELIHKIYNKTIEFNIVNLKYINLNSDIYTQAIVIKLKKKLPLLRVLRSCLKLVKLPSKFLFKNKDEINNANNLNLNRSLNIQNLTSDKKDNYEYKDVLNVLFERLFPNSLSHNNINKYNSNSKTKIISILNTIKYKWTTGVRLEAAGRLTRRYTAERAVFKIRYKGNLKNKHYYVEWNKIREISTVMLRHNVKANSQYSFIKSDRRIGAFGIKNTISSY